MAVSQAQRMAVAKYRQEKRDQLAVDVPKGKREEYKAKAARLGLSLSMLIQHSVEGYGANHGGGEVIQPTTENQLSAEQRKFLNEFSRLSPKSQKALREIISELVDKKGGGENGND